MSSRSSFPSAGVRPDPSKPVLLSAPILDRAAARPRAWRFGPMAPRALAAALLGGAVAAGAALAPAAPPPSSDPFGSVPHDDFVEEMPAGGIELSVSGECPGEIILFAINATPGGRVGFAYSFAEGSTPVPGCPGLSVDLARAVLAGIATANEFGDAMISGMVPPAACGVVIVQAVDVATCTKSNTAIVETAELDVFPFDGVMPGGLFCLYQALTDCPPLGIRAGQTLCIRCPQQRPCPHGRGQRVTINIHSGDDCNNLICRVISLGMSPNCVACPDNSPHRFADCP